MEFTKPEVAAVLASVEHIEAAVKELDALELAMVGGGVGEVILA